jgi:adenine specific DNA methylase Mod
MPHLLQRQFYLIMIYEAVNFFVLQKPQVAAFTNILITSISCLTWYNTNILLARCNKLYARGCNKEKD